MPNPCKIEWETLLNYQEDRLNATQRETLEQHLSRGCLQCTAQLRWLSEFLPALPDAVSQDLAPSPAAITFANRLANLLPKPEPSGLTRFIAQLASQSGMALATAGARGISLPAVQRVYTTERHLITLWDEPEDGNHRYLIGQIYSQSGNALYPQSVQILRPGALEQEAVQEDNEFHLAGITAGSYLLRCRFDTEEIIVPEIEVGS